MLVPTEKGTSSSGSLNAKEPPSTRPRLGAVPEHVVAAPALIADSGQTNVEGAPGSPAAGASPSRAPSSRAESSGDELVALRLQMAQDEHRAAVLKEEVTRQMLLAAEKRSSQASHSTSRSRHVEPIDLTGHGLDTWWRHHSSDPLAGVPTAAANNRHADPFAGLPLGTDFGSQAAVQPPAPMDIDGSVRYADSWMQWMMNGAGAVQSRIAPLSAGNLRAQDEYLQQGGGTPLMRTPFMQISLEETITDFMPQSRPAVPFVFGLDSGRNDEQPTSLLDGIFESPVGSRHSQQNDVIVEGVRRPTFMLNEVPRVAQVLAPVPALPLSRVDRGSRTAAAT